MYSVLPLLLAFDYNFGILTLSLIRILIPFLFSHLLSLSLSPSLTFF